MCICMINKHNNAKIIFMYTIVHDHEAFLCSLLSLKVVVCLLD